MVHDNHKTSHQTLNESRSLDKATAYISKKQNAIKARRETPHGNRAPSDRGVPIVLYSTNYFFVRQRSFLTHQPKTRQYPTMDGVGSATSD